MSRRKRRSFSPEEKAEAAALVRTSGRSVYEVARELDLTETALRRWVKQATIDAGEGPRGGEAAALRHSDRGCQYTSSEYQGRLRHHGITPSMSRRGNCWDNAPVESFFSTPKRELANRSRWTTRLEAQTDVYEYIEAFYNRRLRHSSLGWSGPADFEMTFNVQAS